MTDDERLREIAKAMRTMAPTADVLSRIHAILRDPEPSVEWRTSANGDFYAEADDGEGGEVWHLFVQGCDDGRYSTTVRRRASLSASEWRIPDLDAAKRRAVTLYRALKGAERCE